MKIIADTNILVGAITGDDPRQSLVAQRLLADAELVAIAMPALCELVWVLSRGYKIHLLRIGEAIRRLTASANVTVNRPGVHAGLAALDAGGDFAEGAIAFEGSWLGGSDCVSFDQEAVRLLSARGQGARVLG